METRTITQVKVYVLSMNPVTDRAERNDNVAIATEREKLIDWYKQQFAEEVWQDDRFRKSFKKGSPLEWYNKLDDAELTGEHSLFGHGIHEMWINEDVYRDVNIFKIL